MTVLAAITECSGSVKSILEDSLYDGFCSRVTSH